MLRKTNKVVARTVRRVRHVQWTIIHRYTMAFHPLLNTNMSPNFKKKQIVSMQVIVFGCFMDCSL